MIFYFSGTGNTRWAAQQITALTGEELRYIPDELHEGTLVYDLKDGERLGFCFPTHGWQPPRIVRDFISKAFFKCAPSTYIFALTTCGDDMGHAMRLFDKDLAQKHLQANAHFAIVMPESNVCFNFLHLDTPEKEHKKLEAAKTTIAEYGKMIVNRQSANHLVKGPIPYTYTYILGAYYVKHLITDKKFWVDKETCIQCGLCQKLCPVDDIEGTPPHWKHNGKCTNCLACYHHCPKHAIHWAKMKRGQYVFKEV